MNIWYMDNSGNFQKSENSTVIKLESMLQEIQTFTGEQSFNAASGIDYLAVFNKKSMIKPQLEKIIAKYQKYFQNIQYTVSQVSQDSIAIKIEILLFSGEVESREIIV